MAQSNPPRRSRILLVAMVAVLGLALVGLTQCRNVADSLTGTQVTQGHLGGGADCIHGCNDRFQAGQKAEQDTHKAAVKACGNDSACLAAEETRHEGVMDALGAAMDACKNACYNEGSGGAGS